MDNRPRRKPIRAPGWDYLSPGPYHVTICTGHRAHLFDSVSDGVMILNEPGLMTHATWQSIARAFPGITLDAYVVMPNHLHGLLTLPVPDGPDLDGCIALSDVMRWFKTETTARYSRGVRRSAWSPFDGHLWQRGYYDEIVRSDRGLDRVRHYIEANPATWTEDDYFADGTSGTVQEKTFVGEGIVGEG